VLQISGATHLTGRRQAEAHPGHCDPTVNLYDNYVCWRNGKVEAMWPVTARGALL